MGVRLVMSLEDRLLIKFLSSFHISNKGLELQELR